MDHCLQNKTIFDRSGYQPVSIGKRLRELRTGSGYSIKKLAEKSGLAVNTLSLIENEKTSPSVNTLEQLARALEIPLTCFFKPNNTRPRIIKTQPGDRKKMILEGMLIEDCGLELEEQPLQPLIVTLSSGMDEISGSCHHTGYEFVYCLSGRVDYFIENVKYSLSEGESLALDASLPHRWINPCEEPAVYLLIMVPGDIGELNGEVHFQSSFDNGK